MKFYIAGPTDGRPAFNQKAFEQAEAWLNFAGHEATSKIHLDKLQGWEWTEEEQHSFDLIEAGYPVKSMMLRDLQQVIEADALLLLEDWKVSKHVWLELAAARWARNMVYVVGTNGRVLELVETSWIVTPFNPADGFPENETITVVDEGRHFPPTTYERPDIEEIIDVIREGRDGYSSSSILDALAELIADRLEEKGT